MDFYKKARGIGKGTYFTKVTGYPLGAATLLIFRFQIGDVSWLSLASSAFFVLYPHLSFAWYIKKGCNSSVEIKALAFDGFLVGIFAAQVHFAFLPTACFFIVPAATAMGVKGPKLFLANAALFAAGATLAGLVEGFHYMASVSLEVQVLSIIMLLFGTVAHNYVDYRRSLKFIAAKEQIKQQKQKIEENLQEKELLLKEIHHRVKNNLQIIISLLNLQAEHIEDHAAINAIKASRGRVKSMSMVHEILYQTDNLKQINIADYIPRLTDHLQQMYANASNKIEIIYDIPQVNIDIKTAIPLGLIINELVSNSFKHAFKGINEGVIRLVAKNTPDKLLFTISDNGTGMTVQTVPASHSRTSLGTQLIDDMTKQLNARKDVITSGGTEYQFTIPLPAI